jgi:hypothetical protein
MDRNWFWPHTTVVMTGRSKPKRKFMKRAEDDLEMIDKGAQNPYRLLLWTTLMYQWEWLFPRGDPFCSIANTVPLHVLDVKEVLAKPPFADRKRLNSHSAIQIRFS